MAFIPVSKSSNKHDGTKQIVTKGSQRKKSIFDVTDRSSYKE